MGSEVRYYVRYKYGADDGYRMMGGFRYLDDAVDKKKQLIKEGIMYHDFEIVEEVTLRRVIM